MRATSPVRDRPPLRQAASHVLDRNRLEPQRPGGKALRPNRARQRGDRALSTTLVLELRSIMANFLAWLFLIMVVGGLLVGLVGLLMPLILFAVGVGLAVLAFALLAWLVGRILS